MGFLTIEFVTGETQVDELAMELLLLLVILPAVQDQNHTREWLKNAIRAWCSAAAWILDLRSYLFGDTPEDLEIPANEENAVPVNEVQENDNAGGEQDQMPNLAGLAAAHQALLQREGNLLICLCCLYTFWSTILFTFLITGPVGFQPYKKPKMFPLLICGLIILMLVSWLVASLLFMLIPVWMGRQIFALWFEENPRVYELYTAAMGLYTCLLIIRGATLVIGWIQQGWAQLSQKLREWTVIVSIWF